MQRIRNLDINKTDRVYKMSSGRMLKVRVLKDKVLKNEVSFIVSCSHVDKKGKALETKTGHCLAPPFVVTIPIDAKEHPIDIIKKQIEGHTFTKRDEKTGIDKTTVIKGRLEEDDKFFANMKVLNNLEKDWSES